MVKIAKSSKRILGALPVIGWGEAHAIADRRLCNTPKDKLKVKRITQETFEQILH
jgi:hypothetical protein